MLKFLAENWVVLAGVATGITFLLERTFNVISDRKKRKEVYNHCLLELVKLFEAYSKQKSMLFNPVMRVMPPAALHKMMRGGNNLEAQLAAFNDYVEKKAELVPDLIIQSYFISNLIDRMFIIERATAGDELTDEIITNIYNQQRALAEGQIGGAISFSLHDMAGKVAAKSGLVPAQQKKIVGLFDPKAEAAMAAEERKMLLENYESLHRLGQFTEEQMDAIRALFQPVEAQQ